jgi:hypothetical protein|tara:strand:+ start:4012 stop:4695 length:684 start_codon:yes stop_codon:yes gene_type:complete
MSWRAGTLVSVFALVDPTLHTNDSINGLGFGKSIVDGNTESLKRNFPFAIPLGACDISTTEATCATNPDAIGAEVHCRLNRTLHSTAKSNTTLELNTNIFADTLGIKLRLADLNDVDFHLGTTGYFADLGSHELNLGTFAADDESGAGGVKGHTHAVPGTLNDHFGKCHSLKTSCDVFPDPEILVKFTRVVFAFGIPLGAPVFVDGEAEADWINFLSHDSLKVDFSV